MDLKNTPTQPKMQQDPFEKWKGSWPKLEQEWFDKIDTYFNSCIYPLRQKIAEIAAQGNADFLPLGGRILEIGGPTSGPTTKDILAIKADVFHSLNIDYWNFGMSKMLVTDAIEDFEINTEITFKKGAIESYTVPEEERYNFITAYNTFSPDNLGHNSSIFGPDMTTSQKREALIQKFHDLLLPEGFLCFDRCGFKEEELKKGGFQRIEGGNFQKIT